MKYLNLFIIVITNSIIFQNVTSNEFHPIADLNKNELKNSNLIYIHTHTYIHKKVYRQRETIIATNTLFVPLIGISFNTLWKITGDKGERIRRGIQLIQYPILCSYSNATRYPLTKDVLFLSPYFEILRVSSHRGKIPSLKIVRQIYM